MATSGLGAASRGGDDSSSYYSSEEEDVLAADAERGTRRLLRDQRSSHYATEPLPTAAAVTSVYPQIHSLAPATPATPVPAPAAPQVAHNSRYGSVSSSLPSTTRSKPKTKRYRLPLFILLVFDCGLVIFLSIIAYDSKVNVFAEPWSGLPNNALL